MNLKENIDKIAKDSCFGKVTKCPTIGDCLLNVQCVTEARLLLVVVKPTTIDRKGRVR